MEILIILLVAAVAGLLILVGSQNSERAAPAHRLDAVVSGARSVEFDVRYERNGAPDFQQFRNQLPQHGNYEFNYAPSGGPRFRFLVQRHGSTYRVYVMNRIDYRGRATDGHSTHLISNGPEAAPHICHKDGHAPRDLPSAAAIAVWWAKCTSQYIRNGRSWS